MQGVAGLPYLQSERYDVHPSLVKERRKTASELTDVDNNLKTKNGKLKLSEVLSV